MTLISAANASEHVLPYSNCDHTITASKYTNCNLFLSVSAKCLNVNVMERKEMAGCFGFATGCEVGVELGTVVGKHPA